jgi:predicted RNase H-like HicB family nuclease
MRFRGKIQRSGRHWAIEVPLLDVYSQGRTKSEAFEMIADAIESLVDEDGFTVSVHQGRGGHFEIDSERQATLMAFFIKRARRASGLTLVEVADRLGARSHNAYARYEQGRCRPTVDKLEELLEVVAPGTHLVLTSSEA